MNALLHTARSVARLAGLILLIPTVRAGDPLPEPPVLPPIPDVPFPDVPSPIPDVTLPTPDGQTLGANVIQITTRSNPEGPLLAEAPQADLSPQTFTIESPIGAIPLTVRPAGPNLSLAPLPIPEPAPFRPPSFFSAPLPAGSGARALGVAGSFSSIADDATAASWNPAGLVQLERPEISVVLRQTFTKNEHRSTDPSFQPSDQDYQSRGINYFSVAYPLYLEALQRNLTVSMNYQEAYDFTQYFAARSTQRSEQRTHRTNQRTFTETQRDQLLFQDAMIDVEVLSTLTTRSTASLTQSLTTELNADIEFEQDGFIEAASPALAMELTPSLSVGAALNFYCDSPYRDRGIRSRTSADYVSRSERTARVSRTRETSGSYTSRGVVRVPGIDDVVEGFETELPTVTGDIPDFRDTSEEVRRDRIRVEGTYEETNVYDDLFGVNATVGLLWTPSRLLTLGAAVDLPWTAETTQHRRVRTASTTYDEIRNRVLAEEASDTREKRDAEFHFPMFWTAGLSLRWTPAWYTSLDAGQTRWSEFSFQSDGEPKINPLNGAPHQDQPLDDTWFARLGTEYLVMLKRTEIPLRAGLLWEQRPAIGRPDDYYGFSLGTGMSLGAEPRKLILDIAYTYLQANDVQTVAPSQPGLSTDTRQQQIYVSAIWHF